MDKDWRKGIAHQVTGSVKKILGRTLGNKRLENDDRAEKIVGKVQGAVGGLKNGTRNPTEG